MEDSIPETVEEHPLQLELHRSTQIRHPNPEFNDSVVDTSPSVYQTPRSHEQQNSNAEITNAVTLPSNDKKEQIKDKNKN